MVYIFSILPLFVSLHVVWYTHDCSCMDSICNRDDADMPISLNEYNGLELLYAAFLDKQHALRVLLFTVLLSKYVKYTATVIFVKPPILLLLIQTTYHYWQEVITLFTKTTYTGAYMILD